MSRTVGTYLYFADTFQDWLKSCPEIDKVEKIEDESFLVKFIIEGKDLSKIIDNIKSRPGIFGKYYNFEKYK